jgi:hypothetical protein
MKKKLLTLTLSIMVLSCATNTCRALAPFKKAFDEKYVKSSDNDALKAAFKSASCNTCHVKGKKKDWLNGYGVQLAKQISGNAKDRLAMAKAVSTDAQKSENEKLLKELKKAFNAAESAKSPSGPLFGALFSDSTLPSAAGAKSIRAETFDADDKSNTK